MFPAHRRTAGFYCLAVFCAPWNNGPTFNGRGRADRLSVCQNAQRGAGPLQRLVMRQWADNSLRQPARSFYQYLNSWSSDGTVASSTRRPRSTLIVSPAMGKPRYRRRWNIETTPSTVPTAGKINVSAKSL